MQHTAHHAIKVRLTMWKAFFETLRDATPDDATDAEYGLDALIDLAREGDNAELHDLADVVELMGQNYIAGLNHAHARALMQDASPKLQAPRKRQARVVSMAELDAALAG